MSAFIVDEKTISRDVTWLSYEVEQTYQPLHHAVKRFATEHEIDIASDGWEAKMASEMLALNYMAVDTRYGKGRFESDETIVFKWEHEDDRIQVLKSIHCWLYQCSEGQEIETTPLYRFWSQVAAEIARDTVVNLPAYNKAKWG